MNGDRRRRLRAAVIDGRRCDEAAREFVRRWFDVRPANCR